jgi:lipopolysaccharide biosynthesis protein
MDAALVAGSELFRPEFARGPYETAESRQDSARAYIRAWASGIALRKPFPGFHPGIYAEQQGLALGESDPFADFLRAGAPAGLWRYPVITPMKLQTQDLPPGERAALHVHAYFPEMLADMVQRLMLNRALPVLFVSVPDERAHEIATAQLRGYCGRIGEIRIVPNRGRDIGPLLDLLGRISPQEYDFIGHIHTKKSLDVKDGGMGRMWYRFLMNNLLGGETAGAMSDRTLHALAGDPSLGMVFPDDPWIVGWDGNRAIAEPLAAAMGVQDLTDQFIFPVGTMFWAKLAALQPLRRLNLEWNDYPEEPIAYDGTMLHALERLMPWAVRAAGFAIATTHVAGLTR